MTTAAAVTVAAAVAMLIAGCGFAVQEPDLFLLTRTGPGARLTELVNSDGTIRCNGHSERTLSSSLLIAARDIQPNLHFDATKRVHIARAANSVYMYSVRVDAGTITFPDTAAAHHPTLAQLELFATQAAQSACGIS